MQSRATDGFASDRNLARAAAAASLLALGALFWPAALRRVFVFADLGNFLLPFRIYLSENLARGITPLWMPNLFCGFYAHGEGQIGIFHPLRWLLYRLLPVSEAFNLECLLPYTLALIGTALFLRRLALPASAAIFGGASFAFSACLTLRLTNLNAVEVLAHLGWLLLAIDAMLREGRRTRHRAWLAIALLTGSQGLVGYPVAIAYCWMLAIPYAVFIAVSRRELAPLAAASGALAVGVLLAGIQLVPTWDHALTSQRATFSLEKFTEFSLHPLNLVSIVSPWLFRNRVFQEHDYDPIERVMYFGAVVPIAAHWVWLRRRQLGPWQPFAAGLAALSALALILALGANTPLYRYFLSLPLVGWLRVPARYTVVLYFSGAVFAAIAFADLLRGDRTDEMRRRSARIWTVPAASWLVAAIALALRDPSPALLSQSLNPPSHQLSPPLWIVLGPASFTLAAALFVAAARGYRAALFALVPLALADHAAYAAALWWVDPPRTVAEYRAGIARPPASPLFRVHIPHPFTTFYTIDGRGHWWSATRYLVHDARIVSGYAGLMPAKQLDYSKPASLRVAGAAAQRTGPRFARLAGPLPRARLVASAQHSAQPAIDVEAIDVATTALVDEPVDLEAGPAGTAAIEEDRAGAIRIAVEAPTRQLLVVAESFHPGWRADIDGADAGVLRVNGDFMGVVVGAGAHEVQLRFAPRSFAVGCWTSLAGIGIVLAVAIAGLCVPRRP